MLKQLWHLGSSGRQLICGRPKGKLTMLIDDAIWASERAVGLLHIFMHCIILVYTFVIYFLCQINVDFITAGWGNFFYHQNCDIFIWQNANVLNGGNYNYEPWKKCHLSVSHICARTYGNLNIILNIALLKRL